MTQARHNKNYMDTQAEDEITQSRVMVPNRDKEEIKHIAARMREAWRNGTVLVIKINER